MTLPSYLLDFFSSLQSEERNHLKEAFEGDFSNVGKFTILAEKYLEGNEVLLGEIIKEFIVDFGVEAVKSLILNAQREKIKRELSALYKELESAPGPFYERQIQHNESRILHLSMSSIEDEAYSIFDSVISDIIKESNNPNLTKETYIYVFYLGILYEEYKFDTGLKKKYHVESKKENNLYKYYRTLGVNLRESDRQFLKYNLLSVSSSEQIISGLPSRIFDSNKSSQFLVETPEPLLDLFIYLLDIDAIKSISFLVGGEVVFQTPEQYFILLGNEQKRPPVLLEDFLNATRDSHAITDVIKSGDVKNMPPTQVGAGRFYDKDNDSAWYFIDDRNIYFEELARDPEVLDDCVVTQLVHVEYFVANNNLLLSHIDHEYIFYSYDEYDKRLEDFSQKGSARKRIKTFKIDRSEIPLIVKGGVLVLNTILEYIFEKPYLFNNFLLKITKNSIKSSEPVTGGEA